MTATYSNQLTEARRVLAEKGRKALMNPHGLTGKICGCKDCFCCAAWQVLQEEHRQDCLNEAKRQAEEKDVQ